ncbi:transcriptional regulator [Streptomyces sp. NBC_01317]|uniref:BTAD domain-containing putative transcriptional regulator n=1 Tax=Streptomyces sp. NBC_01317 TaxID=2903822 RepID=UPI002E0E22FB|nr:transcriptional regulator [Streptomyces sp. NBC_01317]WSJ48183.1 transcriptional regulator [Streptomyces sp. NBC_01317]
MELGGIRQRSALAYLLLHANEVVSTSRLLGALWPADDAPMTARKILQNAIWRLRGVLAGLSPGEPAPELLTWYPGYMLRVRPEQVDLLVFQQRVAEGRVALAAGRPAAARDLLTEALALWRGPVLADLAEEGTYWAEVTSIQKKRLDVMEDCFEAELACGGHQSVLHELKALVEAEPLRERASRQLMLAFYRCGRQADALAVYGRVREALVEGLGLEPSPELQQLQRAVLTQDPALDLPRTAQLPRPGQTQLPPPGQTARPPRPGPPAQHTPPPRQHIAPPSPHTAEPTAARAALPGEYRQASVLLLRFGLGPEFGTLPPEDVDRVLDAVTQLAREKIEAEGGIVASALGSVLLGLFEDTATDTPANAGAVRAVRAAAAVRDCLAIAADTLHSTGEALSAHGAVSTGQVVVCRWPGAGVTPPWIGGHLVDDCRTALGMVPAGEVHVCEATRRLTDGRITYRGTGTGTAPWKLMAVGDGFTNQCGTSAGDRECELDLMRAVLLRTRHRSTPHLVTVLGPPGRKARLLLEFQRLVRTGTTEPVRVLTGTVAPSRGGMSAPAQMLASYAGTGPGDTPGSASAKLDTALAGLTDDQETRAALLAALGPLIYARGPVRRAVLGAWRDFLALAAAKHPLVVIWDDLERADEPLLELVEELADPRADLPLLNVVGADARLLARRPGWAAGRPQAMTISLGPVADDALDQLLECLLISGRAAVVA